MMSDYHTGDGYTENGSREQMKKKAANSMTNGHAENSVDNIAENVADATAGAGTQLRVEPSVDSVLNEAAATDGGFDAATGAPPAETSNDQLVAQLQSELEAEKARYAELYDKFQRSAAEFQNARRRLEKQMSDAIDRASVRIVTRLLPQVDDLGLAFAHLPENPSDDQMAWIDGFRQIQKKLLALLDEEGVTLMALDGEFDPTRHEAVSSEPNESVESGHIISTLRVGYEQKGRVLRPALVRVAA